MNRLLKHYRADVEFPGVSGAEHLEMLQIRDKLARIENQLSHEDRVALMRADLQLLEQADVFYAELSRFINLAQRRQQQQIPPARWWWYLDVLAQLPRPEFSHVGAKEAVVTAVG
ncbi:MAG: hypothetical protein ACE5HA_03055 [Anaerolineae bacterium]